MITLTGTLKERLDQAIRLSNREVSTEEIEHFRYIYDKAGIRLLPSAVEFYRQYGGVFRKHYLVLNKPEYNREVYLGFFADYSNPKYKDPDREALSRLEDIMLDYDLARDYAKEEVCPVGEIGFYYPAEVFVGENGLLYCVYDFQDEIETFNNPAEILESYLKNLVPIGIDFYPIKTHL